MRAADSRKLPMSVQSDLTTSINYLCWGYKCECGERVTTWRVPVNEPLSPDSLTFSPRFRCNNGHSRLLTMQQVICAPLQWTEDM